MSDRNPLNALGTALMLSRSEHRMKELTAQRLGKTVDELSDLPHDVLEDTMRAMIDEVLDQGVVTNWAHHQVNHSIKETVASMRLRVMTGDEDAFGNSLNFVEAGEDGEYPPEIQLSCLIQQISVFMFQAYVMGREADTDAPKITPGTLTRSIAYVTGLEDNLKEERPPGPGETSKYVDQIFKVLEDFLDEQGQNWIERHLKIYDGEQAAAFLVGLTTGLEAQRRRREGEG
jgi:hypothetical protein